MTPEQAAWVREHVWTDWMREVYDRRWPWRAEDCACERQKVTAECEVGDCARCSLPPSDPNPMPATDIYTASRHRIVARFATPYAHPSPRSNRYGGDPIFSRVAWVWLADRTCRVACVCICHTGAEPPPRLGQLDLFAEVA